ncbi:MAG: HAD-IA family hydrolase, partial [Alphaproteobacteria bacterium]|nr:HAD-IA family hydrolase [Alphaproteobacteria bacterium]
YIQDKIYEISNILDYEKSVVITSYSKSYGIPGLKLGHLLAGPDFINSFYRHASTSYGSPPSFLYMVASCLAKMRNDGSCLDDVVATQFSNPENIFTEFKLWQRQKKLFNEFNKQQIVDTFNNDSNYTVILPDNDSGNIILRANIRQPSYLTMLQLLVDCNVSVMPLECFFPAKYTNHDMRITTSVNPVKLHDILPLIKQRMDDVIKQESSGIKYILWDNDGVLVDTEKLFFDATKQALNTIGIKVRYKDFARVSLEQGKNLIEYYGKKYNFPAAKIVKVRDTLYSKMISSGVKLNSNIFDTVKKMKEMGVVNAIVTGSDKNNFYAMHKNNKEFLGLFDLIVTRSDYKQPKPEPDSYKCAMTKLNAKPFECLVVEDSIRGITAAKQCGVDFVRFDNAKNVFRQIKKKISG